jgi:hypothetical protein
MSDPASDSGAEPPAVKTEPLATIDAPAPPKEDASPPAKPARVVLVKPDAKLSPRPAKKRDVEVQAEQPGFLEELWKMQREAIRAEVRRLMQGSPFYNKWIIFWYNKSDVIDCRQASLMQKLLEAEGLQAFTAEFEPSTPKLNERGKPVDSKLVVTVPLDPLLEPIARPPSKQ